MSVLIYTALAIGAPLLSFVISVFFNRNKTHFDHIFSMMPGYMFLTELAGTITGDIIRFPNYFIYNIYCIIFPLITFWMYSEVLSSKAMVNQIKALSGILLLVFITENILAKNFFSDQQQYTFIASTIILVYIISVYMLQILRSDTILHYNRSKSFWISLGLLLFSVPFIPIMISFRFVNVNPGFRMIINSFLILIMHICFIIATLKSKHE